MTLYVKIVDPAVREWYVNHASSRSIKDSGFDLLTTEPIIFSALQRKVLGCGIACRYFSEGRFKGFDIRARSSISKTPLMIQNGVGTVDAEFTGEIKVALISLEDYAQSAKKPVAQLVFNHETFEVVFVNELPGEKDVARGAKGFGSTETSRDSLLESLKTMSGQQNIIGCDIIPKDFYPKDESDGKGLIQRYLFEVVPDIDKFYVYVRSRFSPDGTYVQSTPELDELCKKTNERINCMRKIMHGEKESSV